MGLKFTRMFCTSSVDMIRSNHIKQHMESKKHTESFALKRPSKTVKYWSYTGEKASGRQLQSALYKTVDWGQLASFRYFWRTKSLDGDSFRQKNTRSENFG